MKNFPLNHYEQAFGNWLIDNRVQYVPVDEQKRTALGTANVKSFDYLIKLSSGQTLIAEVKGRAFKGNTLAGLARLDCWVTADDIDSLSKWQDVFGTGYLAAFIFAYRIENVDVDLDGREVYDSDSGTYIFFCVKLDDYKRHMKLRSPKWRTVTLPAESFKKCAVQMQNVLF